MKFSVEKVEKYTRITLDEEKLDTFQSPILKTEFISLFQSGTKNLILNLSHIKYIDSSGLSAILLANRIVKEKKGALILVNINPYVMKIIKISKLDTILNILPTEEEAVDIILLDKLIKNSH